MAINTLEYAKNFQQSLDKQNVGRCDFRMDGI